LKIDPQGKLQWVRNFAREPQFNKVPAAGAVDHENGIYATGQGVDPVTGQRFPYTLKYDRDGKLIFVKTGAGNGGVTVAVDPAGKILLGGFTLVDGSPAETAAKFDPSGKRIWVTQVPSAGKIVSDSEGNVFASGDFYSVTKLSPAGKIISTFNGQSQFPGVAVSDAVVDQFGRLLVTGYGFDQKIAMTEIVTLKFPKNF
jgi:DNA-binding beta-propeller fold protein YncE